MWDLIVSVPDHCLSFYFEYRIESQSNIPRTLLHAYLLEYKSSSRMSRQSEYGPKNVKNCDVY